MVVPVILELGVALGTVEIIMNEQASMMADFAEEHDVHFLDLTPIFQQKASAGVKLSYPFDTHWNQPGLNLAAESIHNDLKGMFPSTPRNIPGP